MLLTKVWLKAWMIPSKDVTRHRPDISLDATISLPCLLDTTLFTTYNPIGMKRIQAYIRMNRLEDVKEALSEIDVAGMSVEEIRGFGRQQGQNETFRGSSYALNLVPKYKLEMIVSDHNVEDVIEAICNSAQTGELGDGKIFVSDIEDAIRIRTKERGEEAL